MVIIRNNNPQWDKCKKNTSHMGNDYFQQLI